MAVGSHDLSQAEKEITVCKAEQIYKMTTQNGPGWRKLSFWVKIVVILWIYSVLQAVISFSAWDKSCDSGTKEYKYKTRRHEDQLTPVLFVPLVYLLNFCYFQMKIFCTL